MQLYLINNIVTYQVCMLIYLLFVVLILLYKLYIYSFNIIIEYSLYGNISLHQKQILRIYKVYVYINLILLKCFRLQNTAIFFGHILITHMSYSIYYSLLFTSLFVLTLIISLQRLNTQQVLQVSLLIIITTFCFNILWSAVNYFTIVLTLDCLNLIILMFILLDIIRRDSTNGLQLLGAGIYFWISFISTILLLFGGLYLMDSYLTANMNLMLLYSDLLFGCGVNNNINTALYTLFFIMGLLIKGGLGPFFIWKRRLFSKFRLTTLLIYNMMYYMYLFIYIIFILLKLLIYTGFIIKLLLLIITLITIFIIINSLERGPTFGDFIVISTLLNTIFILSCLVALSYII